MEHSHLSNGEGNLHQNSTQEKEPLKKHFLMSFQILFVAGANFKNDLNRGFGLAVQKYQLIIKWFLELEHVKELAKLS